MSEETLDAPPVDVGGPPAPAVASDPEDVVVIGVIEGGPPVSGIISATNEIGTPPSKPSNPVDETSEGEVGDA
jgi:hypothetical protein